MELNLPAKCFISHSYKDAAVRDQLVAKLPRDVPFIFPQINKPDELVSNHLIEAILKCDGLIYLKGGKSEESFWVAFERDYALRAGKQVYSFDPVSLQIEPDTSSPLDLAVFASYARKDGNRIREITKFLSIERYFDIWIDTEDIVVGSNYAEALENGINDQIKRGGYLVAFWSNSASKSEVVEMEIKNAIQSQPDGTKNQRLLFARLDNCPLPESITDYDVPTVQLYGDQTLTETQRLDDLVVRLYWLIYRNTKSLDLE